MKHGVTVEYTEVLLETAANRLLFKSLGWDYLVVWLVVLVSYVVLLTLGRRDWQVGVLGASVFFLAGVAVTLKVMLRRRVLRTFRKTTEPVAAFTFDDDGIAFSSEVAAGTLKWQAVQKVWCFPEAWLFFAGGAVYSTLPTAYLSEEVKRFILDKLGEHGAKISGAPG